MKVALCQMAIEFEKKEVNTRRAISFMEQARSAGADLVLFPEMSLTGFSMNIGLTGEKNRESVELLRVAAERIGIAVGFGWTAIGDPGEGCDATTGLSADNCDTAGAVRGENHYTVISPQGEVLSDYVKIHPFSYSGEDRYFAKGDATAHFTLAGIPFSHFICYDLRFPEIFQAVSGQAHVIIVAADWPGSRREHWKCLLRARAIENQCYILGVNTVGSQNGLTYTGDSCVILPDGTLAAELSDEEGMIYYDLIDDVPGYRQAFPVKQDRRVKLYGRLVQDSM
ncbi:MAG: carbon-nitrogen family hydrolase [Eubacterium sp.]|nr:carbon-nitrogen family hydrolase [Eubacterium sp.]